MLVGLGEVEEALLGGLPRTGHPSGLACPGSLMTQNPRPAFPRVCIGHMTSMAWPPALRAVR